MYGGYYAFETARLITKPHAPQNVLLFIMSLANYERDVRMVFRFEGAMMCM